MAPGEERGDAQVPGLRVRASSTGEKVFFYRSQDGGCADARQNARPRGGVRGVIPDKQSHRSLGKSVLDINVPGLRRLQIDHLVLDYNGTMAVDGKLLPGVKERLARLARTVRVHVLTADTFGKAHGELRGAHTELVILRERNQDRAKAVYVRKIGAQRVACIGNGRNDRLMLRAAALGIALVQAEGAAGVALAEADVVANDVRDALDLFLRPLRLVATLRN